jgi:glycosyltransferase involved in cell wall biosynthesis
MTDLTLVIPAKHESECLPKVLNEISKTNLNCKILISLSKNDIDTINCLKGFNVEIFYQQNQGYGAALIEAINSIKTKYFCIFNADGSFNPKEILFQINKLENNNYDFIFSSRYLKNSSTEDDTILTFVGNKIFTLLGKLFFGLPISDILYTFVLGKTLDFKKITFLEQKFGFCVELPIKLHKSNFQISDIEAHERKRIAGKKKVNEFRDGFNILFCMIKLFFK